MGAVVSTQNTSAEQTNESTDVTMDEDDDKKEQVIVPQTVEKQHVNEDEEQSIARSDTLQSEDLTKVAVPWPAESAKTDENVEYHQQIIAQHDTNNDSLSNDTVVDNNENIQMTANQSEPSMDSENELQAQQPEQITTIVDTNEECNSVKVATNSIDNVKSDTMQQQEGQQLAKEV